MKIAPPKYVQWRILQRMLSAHFLERNMRASPHIQDNEIMHSNLSKFEKHTRHKRYDKHDDNIIAWHKITR
jgi:hypothetical protein